MNMAEINKVVAHLVDGRKIKGTTQDFFPNRNGFHIQPTNGKPAMEILMRDMKALFFVRDLAGNKSYKAVRGFGRGTVTNAQGKKVAVKFKDGELMCGYTLSYSPERDSFFMLPADGGSNNLRVYVVTRSADEIRVGPAAEALAAKLGGSAAA